MPLVYILCTLWAIGVLCATVGTLLFVFEDDCVGFFGKAATAILAPLIGLSVAFAPFVEAKKQDSPTLAILKKNEWHCTKTETVKRAAVVKSQTIYSDAAVCQRYERID